MPHPAGWSFGNHHLDAPTRNFAASPRAYYTINRDGANPAATLNRSTFDVASHRAAKTVGRDSTRSRWTVCQ